MRYDLEEEKGRGGFGIVYSVRGEDGRSYAAKQLNTSVCSQQDHGMLIRRFEREVRYQQQVKHPNVVPVLDAYLADNPPWFVMPLADGSLKDELEADPTLGGNPKRALFDILAGLEALHQVGLCHRDLKPANVLTFGSSTERKFYAISDFGLTTPGVGQTSTLTGSNMAGGTPMYRPPECAINFRRATAQADIYSFGAILHDIFSGSRRLPHSELTVGGPLGAIVEKCTKAHPRRRYASITALRQDLFAVLDKTVVVAFSPEEAAIIDLLNAKNDLSDHEWDRAFNLIDNNADRNISNDNIMRALSLEHIRSIHHSSPDMFHGLGELYADFAATGNFNFDYCDVISDKADVFFDLGDISLKAKIALAMLELGTSHNRWVVEQRFMRMAGHECDSVLAERIKIEVHARQIPFARRMAHICRSINVQSDQLHPTLHELLAQGWE